MSKSCPPLRKEAYEGSSSMCNWPTRAGAYLSDPRGVQKVSTTKVKLSEIFTKFYPDEFKDAYSRNGKKDPSPARSHSPVRRPGFAGADGDGVREHEIRLVAEPRG